MSMKKTPKRVDEVVFVAVLPDNSVADVSLSSHEDQAIESCDKYGISDYRIARCRLVEIPAKKRSKP